MVKIAGDMLQFCFVQKLLTYHINSRDYLMIQRYIQFQTVGGTLR